MQSAGEKEVFEAGVADQTVNIQKRSVGKKNMTNENRPLFEDYGLGNIAPSLFSHVPPTPHSVGVIKSIRNDPRNLQPEMSPCPGLSTGQTWQSLRVRSLAAKL